MNLNDRIANLTGVTYDASRTLGFWKEAARDTISLIISYRPLLLERMVRRVTVPGAGVNIGAESSAVFNVMRVGYPAKRISEAQVKFYNIAGTGSTTGTIFEASEINPVFYIDNSQSALNIRTLKIIPAPTGTDSSVDYIDYNLIDSVDLATEGNGTVFTSVTTATPVAGNQYSFDVGTAHTLSAGDIVTLGGFDITDLNGITAIVDDTNLNQAGGTFELKGIVSPDAVAATTGTVSAPGVASLPTEFIHAMVLKTSMYELHWELTTMKASIPSTTSNDWQKVKTYIEQEEDVELAAAKIQELSNEVQQWLIHYKWVESQYFTLEKEYKALLLPMASSSQAQSEQAQEDRTKEAEYGGR